ncbi:unnamed protein product [Heterobilharzia americana]|nr:unnamed protein product [Heterobilharzia americana]CAH8505665.1 unnamed protein product [Heterobilharzia americana]
MSFANMDSENSIPCQKMNFIQDLMPLSRHIGSPIAKRVLAVLDTTIQKVLTILCLQNIVENVKVQKQENILKHVNIYFKQVDRYNSIKTSYADCADTDKNLSEKCVVVKDMETGMNLNTESHEIEEELVDSIRKLLHFMLSQPLVNQILASIILKKADQLPNEWKLPETISNFKDSVQWINLPQFPECNKTKLLEYLINLRTLLLTKLLTTPEDKKRRKKYIRELENRDQESQTKLNVLIKELDQQICKNNTEVRKIGYTVSKLKNEIDNLEKYLAERIKQVNTEEVKKMTEIKNQINEKEGNLKKEDKNQNQLLQKLIETNRCEEETLRATIYKMETDIETKISKYDQEMTILQDEYDKLEAEYTEEKSAYDELNERFQIINEEYQKIMEERRLQEEKRQREEQERRQMEQAVITIQAFWRSYKTRKLARGKRGGSRKGKR